MYDELKKLAATKMFGERPDHTLQASALYFLAMAWHQLGQPFQTQRSLAGAVKTVEESSADLSWWMRVQLSVLGSEAKAMILR